mmetsp:Transcript_2967/g.7863  ORF Transcript_2967/g.7863 Transcript_2967/m.7863 type:complete len:241 (-) Transcript_2967:240-962(-)
MHHNRLAGALLGTRRRLDRADRVRAERLDERLRRQPRRLLHVTVVVGRRASNVVDVGVRIERPQLSALEGIGGVLSGGRGGEGEVAALGGALLQRARREHPRVRHRERLAGRGLAERGRHSLVHQARPLREPRPARGAGKLTGAGQLAGGGHRGAPRPPRRARRARRALRAVRRLECEAALLTLSRRVQPRRRLRRRRARPSRRGLGGRGAARRDRRFHPRPCVLERRVVPRRRPRRLVC